MGRLTARNEKGLAYLVKVKPNEQAVDSDYPNTLRCILECFKQLADYEDTGLTPDEIRQMQSELEMYRKEWEYVYCLDCEYYSCDDNQNENCPHQHECDLCNSEDGRHRFDRPHYKQKDSAKMKEGNSDTRT